MDEAKVKAKAKVKIKGIEEEIVGRCSILTDATINNFSNNRKCIMDNSTGLLRKLFPEPINLEEFLYTEKLYNIEEVSLDEIERFKLGHYVDNAFIEKVKNVFVSTIDSILIDEIVLLLLGYEYFLPIYSISLDKTPEKNGVFELLTFLRTFPDEYYSACNLSISYNVEISKAEWQLKTIKFDSSTIRFLNDAFELLSDSESGSNLINTTISSSISWKNVLVALKEAQGKDRGRSAELCRKIVVKILYDALFPYFNSQKLTLCVIGELISIVDGYKLGFIERKHVDINNYYHKNLVGLLKVAS